MKIDTRDVVALVGTYHGFQNFVQFYIKDAIEPGSTRYKIKTKSAIYIHVGATEKARGIYFKRYELIEGAHSLPRLQEIEDVLKSRIRR